MELERRWGSVSGRRTVTEAVEPLAEGIDREMAGAAEVGLRQTGAVKLSDHYRPIVVAGRQRHGGASRKEWAGPMVAKSRDGLKMWSAGRLPSRNSQRLADAGKSWYMIGYSLVVVNQGVHLSENLIQ